MFEFMDNLQLLLLVVPLVILMKIVYPKKSSLPGPWKLPAIGNIHQLISLLPPHRRLTDLAGKYGREGVLGLEIGQLNLVVVSSPEAAKQVLTGTGFLNRLETLDVEIFSYNYTNLVFSPHGQHWSRLRRIFDANLLSSNRVDSFRGIRERESARFIRSISESAGEVVIDLSEKIFELVIRITLEATFGGCGERREILGEFVGEIKKASALSGRLDVCDVFPGWPFSWHRSAVQRIHDRLDEILDVIIGGLKGTEAEGGRPEVPEVGGCLVDVLLKGQDDSSLATHQIKPVILDVFMAGTETSSTIIEWAMSELMRSPQIMQKAQSQVREVAGHKSNVEENNIENLPFLDSIVKETLRLHPPTPLIPRQASEDTNILGCNDIPRGTRVFVNAWAIGRDPMHWADPEQFKPERFDDIEVEYKGIRKNNKYSFIPFGGGRRVCPGVWFGKANVMLPLAQLLFHFDWKLPDEMKPEDLDMDEGYGATVGRKNHLRLLAINRRG